MFLNFDIRSIDCYKHCFEIKKNRNSPMNENDQHQEIDATSRIESIVIKKSLSQQILLFTTVKSLFILLL